MYGYNLKPRRPICDVMVELRSDTFTEPDSAMLEAMMQAECGDDVYGEDSTVNLLQERLAEMTGKEAALFLSSGTQSNLVAMLAHCGRGEEVISGDKYHVVIDEAMGASVLGGIALQSVATDDNGVLHCADIAEHIKPKDIHCPVTRLISLENTVHGRVQPLDNFAEIRKLADERGLLMHLDGARLFNAIAEGNYSLVDICGLFDSVSLCLSKGLGAPVGTVLCGGEDFILRAIRLRKMLGGGMRQVGFLAAAGLHAVEHNISDLRGDHVRAQRLCEGLRGLSAEVECWTNMVFLRLSENDRDSLSEFMMGCGIMVPDGYPVIRLVLHRGVGDDLVDYVLEKFAQYYSNV